MNTKLEALNTDIQQYETARAKFGAFRNELQQRINAMEAKLPELSRVTTREYENTQNGLKRLKSICTLIEGEEICELDGLDNELDKFLYSTDIKALNLTYARGQDAGLPGLAMAGRTKPRHPGLAQIERTLSELRTKRDAEIEWTSGVTRRYRYIALPRTTQFQGRWLMPGDILELTPRQARALVNKIEVVTESGDIAPETAQATAYWKAYRKRVKEKVEDRATSSVEATV